MAAAKILQYKWQFYVGRAKASLNFCVATMGCGQSIMKIHTKNKKKADIKYRGTLRTSYAVDALIMEVTVLLSWLYCLKRASFVCYIARERLLR